MRAVLDANVLFPTILREVLMDLARIGLFQPLWSGRILQEWRHAAARLGPDQERIAGAEIALLTYQFSDAAMPDDGDLTIDLNFPDPADRHVVEAALAGQASHVVTANLRDFPRHLLAPLAITAIHPDAFLIQHHRSHPQQVAGAVQAARDKAARMGGDMTVAEMLKRSRLPRLAKVLKG